MTLTAPYITGQAEVPPAALGITADHITLASTPLVHPAVLGP